MRQLHGKQPILCLMMKWAKQQTLAADGFTFILEPALILIKKSRKEIYPAAPNQLDLATCDKNRFKTLLLYN